jgi:hypothetical protein
MLSSVSSPFNSSPYANQLRMPRAIVLINGTPVVWEDITIQTTTFFMSDNYTIVMPLNSQNAMFDLEYWSSVTDLIVKIYIGYPINPSSYTANDLELFMVGSVDLMEVDPLTATIVLSGRDLTSRLIDSKVTKVYPNQTASSIATQLAEAHNLNPVITPTSINVGRYFSNFQTNAQSFLTKQSTEWDLITFLAQQSGFVVYIEKEDLVFKPFPANDSSAFTLNYQPPQFKGGSPNFNGMQLRFKRSLTLANDVIVNVIVPLNPQSGKSFTKSAQYVRRARGIRNIPSPTGTKQTYNFIMAGLTPEQAQQQATTLAQNITIHEIIMSASMPGENTLKKDSLIKVQGTNSSYDQLYYTDTVTRQISLNGYDMQIIAKNHSTDSQAQP